MRWDGGNGLCHLSPLYQPCWWGFHFRLPARKKAAVCKTQASGCDLHLTVGGAKPTIGVTHADFLAHQPVCLENPSGWGLAVVSFFFTYQVAHWRKWWSPRGPATAERWSPEKRCSLEWASGLPLWGQFPCGGSERPLWRKRIRDRQTAWATLHLNWGKGLDSRQLRSSFGHLYTFVRETEPKVHTKNCKERREAVC